MRRAPRFSDDRSSPEGRRTVSTMSESPKPPGTIFAPAAAKASSEIEAPFPAPAWTMTSAPFLMKALMVSGLAATRLSPA